MPPLKDLSGQRFGKLVVVTRAEGIKSNSAVWKCICDCGNDTNVPGSRLTTGKTQSCGRYCQLKEPINFTHKESKTRLYKIWAGMKDRCSNEKTPVYKQYGGRGIRVCAEWGDYLPFRSWAHSTGYSETLSIDRIDVNGDYEPTNCQWATQKEQMGNTRDNIPFIATSPDGIEYEAKNQKSFAQQHGLYNTNISHCLRGRLKSTGGWTFRYADGGRVQT